MDDFFFFSCIDSGGHENAAPNVPYHVNVNDTITQNYLQLKYELNIYKKLN